jgi:2'-5' RNA ligase
VELADVSRRIVIAYWLIPSGSAYSFFQGLIEDLARRYDAPVFEPHVTVHVGADDLKAVETALEKISRDCNRIDLAPLDNSHSSEFIKTVFVQFDLDAKLRRLNQMIRSIAQDPLDYRLEPHLSLLYKTMSFRDRRFLAGSIEVPFQQVTFNSLKAVRCISPTQTRGDVEAWRVLAEKELGT